MNKDFLVEVEYEGEADEYILRTTSAGAASTKAFHAFMKKKREGRDIGPSTVLNLKITRVAPCVAKKLKEQGTRQL